MSRARSFHSLARSLLHARDATTAMMADRLQNMLYTPDFAMLTASFLASRPGFGTRRRMLSGKKSAGQACA